MRQDRGDYSLCHVALHTDVEKSGSRHRLHGTSKVSANVKVQHRHTTRDLTPKIAADPEFGHAGARHDTLDVLLHVDRNYAVCIDTSALQDALLNNNFRILTYAEWCRQASPNVNRMLGRARDWAREITLDNGQVTCGTGMLSIVKMRPEPEGIEEAHMRRDAIASYHQLD